MTLANGEVREGNATDDGWLVEANVETPERVNVVWGYPTEHGISDEDRAKRAILEGPYGYALDVMLYTEDGESDEDQAACHLSNLGYSPDRTFQENLICFQREYQVYPALGDLTDDTKKALQMVDVRRGPVPRGVHQEVGGPERDLIAAHPGRRANQHAGGNAAYE